MVPQAPPGIATLSLLLQTPARDQPARPQQVERWKPVLKLGRTNLTLTAALTLACLCVCVPYASADQLKDFYPHFTVSCYCNGIPLAAIRNRAKKMLNVKCFNSFFKVSILDEFLNLTLKVVSRQDLAEGHEWYKWVLPSLPPPCHAINLLMPLLMPPSRPTHDQSDNWPWRHFDTSVSEVQNIRVIIDLHNTCMDWSMDYHSNNVFLKFNILTTAFREV